MRPALSRDSWVGGGMARSSTVVDRLSGERRDLAVIALISVGHFFSHFYILALPPLFPVLARDLSIGYGKLGLALAALNVTTAIFQAPIGFLVDRYGPTAILIAGQAVFAGAIAGVGLVDGFPELLALMALAGLGNAVYHPADYAILASRVSDARMGRAFSVHTFGGYLGFAAAPVCIVTFAAWFGWRPALVLSGSLGLVLALIMIAMRGLITVEERQLRPQRRSVGHDLRLLTSPPMLLALLFFTLLAATQGGFNAFTVVFLEEVYGLSLVAANLPLTVFLFASTLGVLIGGWVADRTRRHALVAGLCFVAITVAAVLIAETRLPLVLVALLFAVAGIPAGLVAPARDMLLKAVTPPGATGKVFGFVTTGYNIGGFLAPPLFGLIIDRGAPELVFWLIAVLSMATLLAVVATARQRAPGAAGA